MQGKSSSFWVGLSNRYFRWYDGPMNHLTSHKGRVRIPQNNNKIALQYTTRWGLWHRRTHCRRLRKAEDVSAAIWSEDLWIFESSLCESFYWAIHAPKETQSQPAWPGNNSASCLSLYIIPARLLQSSAGWNFYVNSCTATTGDESRRSTRLQSLAKRSHHFCTSLFIGFWSSRELTTNFAFSYISP